MQYRPNRAVCSRAHPSAGWTRLEGREILLRPCPTRTKPRRPPPRLRPPPHLRTLGPSLQRHRGTPRAARPRVRARPSLRNVVGVGDEAGGTRRRPNPSPHLQRLRLRRPPSIRAWQRWPEVCSATSTSGRCRARSMVATTPGRGPRPSRSPRMASRHPNASVLGVPRRRRPTCAVRSRGASELGSGAAKRRSNIARGRSDEGTTDAARSDDVVPMVRPVESANSVRRSWQNSASARRPAKCTAAPGR